MSGIWKLVVGIGALCLLFFATVQIKHDAIESDLMEKSIAALKSQDLGWARVDQVDGRNAKLSGSPPTPAAAALALEAVEGVFGVHSASGTFDILETVSPFLWMAQSTIDAVQLSGVVPSDQTRKALLESAAASFPNKTLIDEMRVAAGAPGGDWLGAAQFSLAQLATLESGQAKLRNTQAALSGSTETPQVAEALQRRAKDITAGYTFTSDILITLPETEPAPLGVPDEAPDVPESIVVPEKAQIEIDRCQTQIDQIMDGETIRFRTSSAEVFPQPNPLILALADVAKECPSARIVISGHTDTVGDLEANLKLSKARAQAVVNLLVDDGVPAYRLTAEGYGAGQPIADNSTPEGRSANRRIEFRVLYAGP
jgi:OOP family OmpA-OmpF porin